MDPERRTLLSVKLEDIAECETIFSTLMGEDVEVAPQIHRRQRAGCVEPGHLDLSSSSSVFRLGKSDSCWTSLFRLGRNIHALAASTAVWLYFKQRA